MGWVQDSICPNPTPAPTADPTPDPTSPPTGSPIQPPCRLSNCLDVVLLVDSTNIGHGDERCDVRQEFISEVFTGFKGLEDKDGESRTQVRTAFITFDETGATERVALNDE